MKTNKFKNILLVRFNVIDIITTIKDKFSYFDNILYKVH